MRALAAGEWRASGLGRSGAVTVWSGFEPLEVVRRRVGDRLVTAVNAALTESAAALTEVLAACPEAFEAHVARRVDSGRPVWHAIPDPHTTGATRLFVAEIHALISSVLGALRARQVQEPDTRLRAYDAIDLASWRAGQAAQLLTTNDPYPRDTGTQQLSVSRRPEEH
jgi:hypothetical protein